jgi:DNA-directed RNA polymerase subunit omega
MRYPSIDKLLEKVDSKYKLAIISAKRARQIEQKSEPLVEKPRCFKPVGKALEEILDDKLDL